MKRKVTYPKALQTSKTVIDRKVCTTCEKTREVRFFSSKLARVCGDCKKRAWAEKLKLRPGKVNKTRDNEWARAVKERDGWKCCVCGKSDYLNSHHIFSRSNYNLRWYLENGITLCPSHHLFDTELSAHKAPTEFVEWLKIYLGEEKYASLRRKAKSITNSNPLES